MSKDFIAHEIGRKSHMAPSPRIDLRPGVTEPVVLLISRHAIETADTASILGRMKPLLATREDTWRYRGQVTLVVDGYDNDPRELVNIPAVRTFMRKLDQRWPFWAFFFNQVDDTIKLYLSCLFGAFYPGGGAVEIDTERLQEVLIRGFAFTNKLFETYEFPPSDVEATRRGVMEVLERAGMA